MINESSFTFGALYLVIPYIHCSVVVGHITGTDGCLDACVVMSG